MSELDFRSFLERSRTAEGRREQEEESKRTLAKQGRAADVSDDDEAEDCRETDENE